MGIILPRLRGLDAGQRERLLRALTPAELAVFDGDWGEWAHAGQAAPAGDWRTWVVMAGRGFGKTRAGAQWVQAAALADGRARIALVAATVEEARRVMVEGPSGLLATPAHPAEAPRFEPSRRRLVWPGGAEAVLFSGAHPAALRGPEHSHAWCDELAKWRHPDESWAMLQLGLRAGPGAGGPPRALVTTTPRAGVAALRAILADAATVVTGGASGMNPHLAPGWAAAMAAAYGGTRRGREELEGLLDADVEGALWPIELIERSRGAPPARAALVRVVIGVDPPAGACGACGIVACGLDGQGTGHVLADHSVRGLSPEGWARAVAAAAAAHQADRVVAETNQGGAMVRAMLLAAEATMPVTAVTAKDGKIARAEPVAALFELGRVRLAGRFDALEAELRGMSMGGGYGGPGRSPDRADAMVWALWALMLAGRGPPSVRAT